MTVENLYKQIKLQNLQYCRIMRNGKNIAQFGSAANKCASADELCDKIKQFLACTDSGNYVVVCKPKVESGGDNSEFFFDINVQGTGSEPQQQFQGNTGGSYAEIEKKIRAELKAEAEKKELRDLVAELREEKRELQNPTNKLAGVAMELLKRMPATAAMFAGTPQTAMNLGALPAQQSPNAEPEELTEEENKMCDDAIDILLKYISAAEILKIANAVQANPGLIDTLKQFKII